MDRAVKLNQLETVLDDLEYPIRREDAASTYEDVTLQLADGEEALGATIAGSSVEIFDTVDDLASEVRTLLPRHAVGEPYQSEGEG